MKETAALSEQIFKKSADKIGQKQKTLTDITKLLLWGGDYALRYVLNNFSNLPIISKLFNFLNLKSFGNSRDKWHTIQCLLHWILDTALLMVNFFKGFPDSFNSDPLHLQKNCKLLFLSYC